MRSAILSQTRSMHMLNYAEMRPNIKSPYFILSLLLIGASIIKSYLLGQYVADNITKDSPPFLASYALFIGAGVSLILLAFASLCYFKATNMPQTKRNTMRAFLLAPVILFPLVVIVDGFLILLPMYGLVTDTSVVYLINAFV